jgi:outer membrane biosynthesis protein TonB
VFKRLSLTVPLFVVLFGMLACSESTVATPSVDNPTLTTPRPTAQMVATAVPNLVNTPEPASEPTATETPTPAPTSTPEPTATPEPTSTAEPTPTPTPTPPPVLGGRENPVPFIGQVVEILKADSPYWAFVVSDV